MSALASTILLALTISTTENNEFFVTPEWMPRAVASQNTPGSDDWDPSGNTLVGSNSAAMLQAIMDGYCQRAYWFNKAVSNKWNVAQYGGMTPLTFNFPARLNGGDRTIPQDRAVVGLENMYELAENCRFEDFRIYRPSWPCDSLWVSSSVLRCLREGDGGGTSRLDDGLPRGFSWTDAMSYSDIVGHYAVPLAALTPDAFHAERTPAPLLDLWKDICHDDYHITNLTAAADDIITNNYDEAVALTFPESTNSVSWKPSGIFAVTNILDKPRAWMGSAARALAPMDRVYIASRVTAANRRVKTVYNVGRSATYNYGNVSISRSGDSFTIPEPVSISESDWTVDEMDVVTNIFDEAITSAHAKEIAVTEVSANIVARGEPREVSQGSYDKNITLPFFDFFAPLGEHPFRIWIRHNEALNTADCMLTVIDTGDEWVVAQEEIPSSAIINLSLGGGASKQYAVYDYYGGGSEMYIHTRNFADGGGCAFLKACATESGMFSYSCDSGDHPGFSLAEKISDCVGSVSTEVRNLITELWGDPTRPKVYASISDEESRTAGTITGGSFSFSISDPIFGVYQKESEGNCAIKNDEVYTVIAPDNIVTQQWSTIGSVYYVRCLATPTYQITRSPTLETKEPHAAVGDAYLIQSKTFDFGALKIGE